MRPPPSFCRAHPATARTTNEAPTRPHSHTTSPSRAPNASAHAHWPLSSTHHLQRGARPPSLSTGSLGRVPAATSQRAAGHSRVQHGRTASRARHGGGGSRTCRTCGTRCIGLPGKHARPSQHAPALSIVVSNVQQRPTATPAPNNAAPAAPLVAQARQQPGPPTEHLHGRTDPSLRPLAPSTFALGPLHHLRNLQ